MRPGSITHNRNNHVPRHHVWILGALVGLSLGVYILTAALTYRIGFPLDESWIHQIYARNLALNGEWKFSLVEPSVGTSAPLWVVLLAIGSWLGISPVVWVYMLGGGMLWGLSILLEKAAIENLPLYRPRFPWVGAIIVLEWHLVWSAGSGMETLLYCLLATAVLLLMVKSKRYLLIGLLVGISLWIRPDGITLLVPAGFTAAFTSSGWKTRLQAIGNLLFGFLPLFLIYLLFNLVLSETPWPVASYAKQVEYAIYQQIPIWERYYQLLLRPLTGVGLALIPGIFFTLIMAIRLQEWGTLSGMLWFTGYIGIYALLLPVTDQHGRYLIPVIPIILYWGLLGIVRLRSISQGWVRMFVTAIEMLIVTLLVLFWGIGSQVFGQDVAIIESELVDTATWISENLPDDAILATHDIGALGYYGGRQLVDLSGVVSPEVISFLGDEVQLVDYIHESGVDYVACFPHRYPSLIKDMDFVFTTNRGFAPSIQQENMVVYRWRIP